MYYPNLPPRAVIREVLEDFGGLNRRGRTGAGEFTQMENLSSDSFPYLSPRKRRGTVMTFRDGGGLIAKEGLCYVENGKFYANGYAVDLELSPGPKQLTSMGAYVIILPDKKWVNTMDLTQFGNIDASRETSGTVTFALCDGEGEEYTGILSGDTAPEAPENLQLWLDEGCKPAVLRQYSALNGGWTDILTTYVKIHCPGIGRGFSRYDGVTLSGVEALPDLNGSHVLYQVEEDAVLVTGLARGNTSQEGPVTLTRRMPEVDFLVESGNRLWGCRYGLTAEGKVVNEIYASKLGDFKNWNCFAGLSTDSYAASCGTDGPFTGAVCCLGIPHFFKEGCVHKVYGSYPANFQIQSTPLRGVQRGCAKSLAAVGEILYYKGPGGIFAYDGSLPVDISGPLGDLPYSAAVAGALGDKYYIALTDTRTQKSELYVYDTRRGLWHREDGIPIQDLCPWGQDLYAISENKLLALLGSQGEPEEALAWQAVTGAVGLGIPGSKYLSRLTVRLSLEPGAEFSAWARYDGSQRWQRLGSVWGKSRRSFSLSLRPRRCDRLEIKFSGKGGMQLYSLTKHLEEGSELP